MGCMVDFLRSQETEEKSNSPRLLFPDQTPEILFTPETQPIGMDINGN